MKIAIVRPPHTSAYNCVDVREDAIATLAYGYLLATDASVKVFDFHLDPECCFERLLDFHAAVYVITIRETGANVHYGMRLANGLRHAGMKVLLFGQTGRLASLPDINLENLIIHDEVALAERLNLRSSSPNYADGLRAQPYLDQIKMSQSVLSRRRASIETSRGCHFACKFCFINHGSNYPTRWLLRPNRTILEDIEEYRNLGICDVVFHDSEFIGADPHSYQRHKELLGEISKKHIRFKIYSRADTLLRFDSFDLLQDGGLVQVFLGVESLSQTDLDALSKGLKIDNIMKCIDALCGNGIFVNLSFMLFNRSTTVASLRENIRNLVILCSRYNHYLGMPNFLFSFEANWEAGPNTAVLSNNTYLRWMVWKRCQPRDQNVSFDPAFEPLIEVYRVLFYELAQKIAAVNLYREQGSEIENEEIGFWFEQLWPFAISALDRYLSAYEDRRLHRATIGEFIDKAYQDIQEYFELLPHGLREVVTFKGHGEHIGRVKNVPAEDHGWDRVIPGGVA